MISSGASWKFGLVPGALVLTFAVPAFCQGQTAVSNMPGGNPLTVQDANQMYREIEEKNLHATSGDSKEAEAYKAFHNSGSQEPAKRIKLGQDFLTKYPSSVYNESVYSELAEIYYARQDVANFYTAADKAIALNPNDATMLAMDAWVVPRAYHRDDPFAEGRLDKAEQYAKHAIEILDPLPKPEGMTEQQFAQFKNEELATAHSGLGLIYFRQGKLEESAKELQVATSIAATPDPTDFYVLGAAHQNLGRYKDAADAFGRCATVAGPLQQDCKQNAAFSAKQAQQAAPAK